MAAIHACPPSLTCSLVVFLSIVLSVGCVVWLSCFVCLCLCLLGAPGAC